MSKKGEPRKCYKTDANIETFINMILLGCSVAEVCKEIGFCRQNYYDWINDSKIATELDRRRHELYTEGHNFIKGRYKKYLENIDKACNDMSDKRTFLSANMYMVDRIDGKATTKVEVSDNNKETNVSDLNSLLNKYKALSEVNQEESEVVNEE